MSQRQPVVRYPKRDDSTLQCMKHTAYILVLLLILLSLACSLGGLRGKPIPIPNTSDSLDGLTSYRMLTVLQWTPRDGLPFTTTTEIEATRNPFAKRTTITTPEGIQEWIQVGEQVWHCADETCSPQSQEPTCCFGEDILLWNEHVAEVFDTLDHRYIGEEVVNGIRTFHYAISSPPPGVFGPLREDASDVHTEIWIGNKEALPVIVVRTVTTWKLGVEGEQGAGEYSLDIYDVNAHFTIEPPEGVPAAMPEDTCLASDAQQRAFLIIEANSLCCQ